MASAPEIRTPYDYRLSPAFVVRLMGMAVVGLAVVTFLATLAVGVLGLSIVVLIVAVLGVLVAVFVVGWYLRNRAYVLRADQEGYHVRLVRGVGVKQARWVEVEDAVTTTSPGGIDCVVLRLRSGGTTTIPVEVLEIDRELFVRELQERLRRGTSAR